MILLKDMRHVLNIRLNLISFGKLDDGGYERNATSKWESGNSKDVHFLWQVGRRITLTIELNFNTSQGR